MQGRSVDDYDAPLFLAWQLTNGCGARCLACCEESGPGRTWPDELSRAESLDLAGAIVEAGIPFVAFGGGEPLGVPHFWQVIELPAAGGVALKIETDGRHGLEDIVRLVAGIKEALHRGLPRSGELLPYFDTIQLRHDCTPTLHQR